MKNIFLLGILLFSISSCSSDTSNTILDEKENVSISIGYTLLQSGSMSRSSYADFYNKYIDTRKLTPTTYSISFKNKETGDSIIANGYWNENDFFTLREGVYEVSGISYPANSHKKGTAEYIAQDTVSLYFKEDILVQKDINHIVLNAKYDCFMILFQMDNIKNIYFSKDVNPLVEAYSIDDIYYMFFRDKRHIDNYGNVFKSPLYTEGQYNIRTLA